MPNVVADQMCFLQGDEGKIFLNKIGFGLH